MQRRIAIVVSGRTRNFPMTLQNFMDNVVSPNNADVFILFQRDTRVECQHIKSPENDIEYMKVVLGDHLKHLSFTDDDYDNELSQMIDVCTDNISDLLASGKENGYIINNGISPYPIDQYLKIRNISMILEQYEEKSGFKYDIIARSRIDHVFYTKAIDLNAMLEKANGETGEYFFTGGVVGKLYSGSIVRASELLVFGTHDIMLSILKNFIACYGKFRLDKTKYPTLEDSMLSQEVQFGMYLNRFRGICNLYPLDRMDIAYNHTGCTCSHYLASIE